ncbi:MAG TPA: response regulator transcription factor [Bryobacteraceae bacterium]
MKKTRILLIDDHTIFRQGLTSLLNAEPDMEVSLHCASVGEGLIIVASGLADLVLLDLDLGPERGVDFLTQVRINGFHGPVLVLAAGVSNHEKGILDSNGVSVILRKDASIGALAERIREAAGMPPPAQSTGSGGAANRPIELFSERENEVLRLVIEGCANKEIAAETGISEPTVKSILRHLFQKTGAQTRSQLVRFALEHHRDQL